MGEAFEAYADMARGNFQAEVQEAKEKLAEKLLEMTLPLS
jgi:hypothetical protein